MFLCTFISSVSDRDEEKLKAIDLLYEQKSVVTKNCLAFTSSQDVFFDVDDHIILSSFLVSFC